jgi:hypothetical protein
MGTTVDEDTDDSRQLTVLGDDQDDEEFVEELDFEELAEEKRRGFALRASQTGRHSGARWHRGPRSPIASGHSAQRKGH